MREETLSSADCADAFLAQGMASALRCGAQLRERGVRHLEVLGRGSSSHAGTLLRYALAEQGGLGVSAAMPSLAANTQALSHLRGNALVAISQSGKSPDLVRYASAARAAGAYVLALTNTGGSALGAVADVDIALGARSERAVAATKIWFCQRPRAHWPIACWPLVPAYLAIEAAALRAGRNPDQPRGLSKVTETL